MTIKSKNEPNLFLEQFKTTRWLDSVQGIDNQAQDAVSMWFRPRDIGINRYPHYEDGVWQKDEVHSGFHFTDLDDLKGQLVSRYEGWQNNPWIDKLSITPDNAVLCLTVVGYVDNRAQDAIIIASTESESNDPDPTP